MEVEAEAFCLMTSAVEGLKCLYSHVHIPQSEHTTVDTTKMPVLFVQHNYDVKKIKKKIT